MSAADFKTNIAEVLKMVIAGEEINILYGRKKEIVAKMVPQQVEHKIPRVLGPLEGKGSVRFSKDSKISEEEFLGL